MTTTRQMTWDEAVAEMVVQRERAEKAEARVKVLEAANNRLVSASAAMLTGISLHNERSVGEGRLAEKMAGPVIDEFQAAYSAARAAKEQS